MQQTQGRRASVGAADVELGDVAEEGFHLARWDRGEGKIFYFRPGHETYPTYHGWLMYEYSGDSSPGDANGQGIKSFGGTWWVLDASGNPVKSGGGGYGSNGGY